MTTDELYMGRCLQIAAFAEGRTSPNPMVGAVIVHDGRIVGEGYHHRAGQPHAEPNAIASVADPEMLKDSTLYVSLEPCSHYGKTPPCAKLIIEKGIPRVVVAMLDPNPIVAGRGIAMLREAGIEVTVGTLEHEARELNRRFVTFHTKHRPYIMLKWAQSADGYIDLSRKEKGDGPVRISNGVTKTLNHKIRTEEDAILVGWRTALLDDPHLTSRKWGDKNPLRCVIDRDGTLPRTLRLFDGSTPTVVFTAKETADSTNLTYCKIDFSGDIAVHIADSLYRRGVQSVIVEGGAATLGMFISAGLWDEARIETSPAALGSGVRAPIIGRTPVRTEWCCGNRTDIYRNI
ncbi:MAG: bifunctional diaminohydroxyphosphoribosylaminopyrimidine deaminase/5-amino-6-(5-phosphoribosylamino)uracil reductase RibD [bacterium]|uniref:Riboflavin biosynthesis protein RibD n=1 Tax=Candidatus Aphodosoma intestinipullorum TaxID=2840674 RepID=A0A940IEJ4_9BACT|nr:bifunctional diaminohydroxyphosphoribosylaminopyrimidine deaminase/5-amino-6-(5-phosphoribosylamino)uracil reductase RibD [Candidatus Aphodosoma intestinipullorum]